MYPLLPSLLQDIVLTRSQMNENLEERAALSGIVQAMLMTKHLLFVGFSLQDPNFGEVAGTVRSALRPRCHIDIYFYICMSRVTIPLRIYS